MLSPSLPVSLLPSIAVVPSLYARAPMATSIELPKLRIPIEAARRQQETGHNYDDTYTRGSAVGYPSALPVPVKTKASSAAQSPYGPTTRSPSSPSSFFTQSEMAKLGLTPLVEAAEQIRPSTAEASLPLYGHFSPLKRELSLTHRLPSMMHAMGGYPLDASAVPKRARIGSDVDMDMQASNSLLSHMPRQAMIYPSVPQQQSQQQLYHQSNEQHTTSYVPMTEVPNISMTRSKLPSAHGLPACSGASVWGIVLNTGKFPTDICLNENGSGSGASAIALFNSHEIQSSNENIIDTEVSSEVKQGQWPVDEEEHTTALIQAVKKGEEWELPLNVSMRKCVANNLQCNIMQVSKKLPSLGLSPRDPVGQEHEPVNLRDKSFNPLSLKSIMNNESSALPSSDVCDVAETIAHWNPTRQIPSGKSVGETKKRTQRVLKRSDYSQSGMVRSGRWSVEEENYAKAMIEAFKAGYLPLHGNVSLRKFLSEVLMCHPMRISKKFVGYVRKYHWYRITAGKCDLEAKRQALYRLICLERVFWTSLHSERPPSLRRDD
ncbi:unnamed protein product [Peronospora destructor]|uniref:Uncharacterized protein n=1 Tax=Peronospora destructor TaxID=86335 RepID=A0AAV0TR01_9STRA|nr:unnamed protein product [Peronospora destructor]